MKKKIDQRTKILKGWIKSLSFYYWSYFYEEFFGFFFFLRSFDMKCEWNEAIPLNAIIRMKTRQQDAVTNLRENWIAFYFIFGKEKKKRYENHQFEFSLEVV